MLLCAHVVGLRIVYYASKHTHGGGGDTRRHTTATQHYRWCAKSGNPPPQPSFVSVFGCRGVN